jgi:hypothetical protein
MSLDRRAFLAATAAATTLATRVRAQSSPALRPEDFGARGDGHTNDTRAFAALSAEINRRGGGTISLAAKRTYVVGEQPQGGDYGWTPLPILKLGGLSRPLQILGNGARLLCAPGLLYGSFDRASGQPRRRPMPNVHVEEIATPYRAMIWVHDCRAPVAIRDIELDGSAERLRIGGQYGDVGWQIPATGLWLLENSETETVTNVLSHHHAQDGAMIDGAGGRSARSRVSRFVSRYNGRQGLSIVGGRGYDFEDCEFSHTGRSALLSPPGAGVDIEAETKPIRDLTFTRCQFIDNSGVGMVADSGDSAGARFTDCTFVGTTSWSAWPLKPHFRFTGCTFVGAVVHPFADEADPSRATQFVGCRFTDDPALSPTRKVFDGVEGSQGGSIVNMSESKNVVFDRCTFDLVGKAVLPWGWHATYKDCTMTQRSGEPAMTKGKFLGRTTINGPVDLYGSMVVGTLILNGRPVPHGPFGYDIKPW